MPLAPDDVVADRYRVGALRGRGGMAEVHVARDERLGRDVALKVVADSPIGVDGTVDRVRREGAAIASLNHPNVVTLYDVVEEDDDVVLVLELVEGPSLADRIADVGPLSLPEAVTTARQVALGLAAAHDRGLVHRDVTPANVLFAATGEAKVADFGIAVAVGDTASADVLGTVHHVAPERLRGARADRRTDLYGLGCVLYEALTGNPPFTGDTAAVVLAAHLDAPRPRPSERRPDVPPALDDLVVSLLAVDPADRPASARAVAEALASPVMGAPGDGPGGTGDGTGTVPLSAATTVAVGPAAGTTRTLDDVVPSLGTATGAAVPSGGDERPPATTGAGPGAPTAPHHGGGDAGGAGRRLGRWVGPALLALALVAAWAVTSRDEGARVGPGAVATPVPETATDAAPSPSPAPPASPATVPSPAGVTTVEEAVAALRAMLVDGRDRGLVSADGLVEVEDRIGDVVRTIADAEGDPEGKRAQEVDKGLDRLRERIEEQVDEGELDRDLAERLDDTVDDLAALFGVDGQRGNGGG